MQYNFTVNQNITLENQNGGVGEAARAAGAEEFIRELPKGYDTILGKKFSGGVEISTGQWQKIALSRGFYRKAGLLILDEPTASLDVQTEAKMELPRFSGRFFSFDSVGCMVDSAGGLLEVHWREISAC